MRTYKCDSLRRPPAANSHHHDTQRKGDTQGQAASKHLEGEGWQVAEKNFNLDQRGKGSEGRFRRCREVEEQGAGVGGGRMG